MAIMGEMETILAPSQVTDRRLLHVGVRVLLVRGGNKRMAHVFAIRAISFIIQDDGPCPMPCDLKLDGWPFFFCNP